MTTSDQKRSKTFNIANVLTFLRIIAIPVLVVVFYMPFRFSHIASSVIFTFAAITDWLDGYVARSLKITSPLGEFLDPVADKLLIAVALVLIVGERHLPLLAIPAAVIVGREIVISALREWMAEIGKRASIAVTYVGKIKTALQMFSVIILLAYEPGVSHFLGYIGYITLYAAAALTLWSMFMYLVTAWPDLTLHSKNSVS